MSIIYPQFYDYFVAATVIKLVEVTERHRRVETRYMSKVLVADHLI